MRLRGDAAGIEGLPLQLMIVAVVAGLTAPVVYAGLDAYDPGQLETRVRGEVLRLTRAAQQYAIAGGGAETLALDFRGGLFTSIEYVAIGDRPGGPLANVVRYRIGGQGERIVLVDRPAVALVGPDNRTLALGAGLYAIHLEVRDDRVVVSVV